MQAERFPRLARALRQGRVIGRGLPEGRTYRPQYDESGCEHDWDVVDMCGAGGWISVDACRRCGLVEERQ